MTVLTSNVSAAKWQPIFLDLGFMGLLLSPAAWRAPWCPLWAADNDAYAHSHVRGWWEAEGESAWLRMLDKIPAQHPPMFVLLPDVVGDWRATMERSGRYEEEVRGRGIPLALALQDGCDFEEALTLAPDWVFVGGSTEWKLANIRPACEFFKPRGVRVHVGRVNGRIRLHACLGAGVDSCDGTGWARFSDVEIPRLRRSMEAFRQQTRLRWEVTP